MQSDKDAPQTPPVSKLVATKAMAEEGWEVASERGVENIDIFDVIAIYDTMLAAAPTPPQPVSEAKDAKDYLAMRRRGDRLQEMCDKLAAENAALRAGESGWQLGYKAGYNAAAMKGTK